MRAPAVWAYWLLHGGGFALMTAHREFSVAAPNYGRLPSDLSVLDGACPIGRGSAVAPMSRNLIRRKRTFWYATGLFVSLVGLPSIGFISAHNSKQVHSLEFAQAVLPLSIVPIHVVI